MMGDDTSKLPDKLYYRIGEVASLVGVEPHVLRYWEREFRTIRPRKSARGQRVYSRRDVETLMRVRELLYSEGFTIAGARRRLQQERSGNAALEPAPHAHDGADGSNGAERAAATREDEPRSDDGAASEARGSESGESGLDSAPAHKPDGARVRRAAPVSERSLPLFDPTAFVRPEPIRTRDKEAAAALTSPAQPERREEPRASAEVRTMLRELRGEIETFLDDLG